MNESDFASRCNSHRVYLLRVAVLQLRDNDLAEDVVQETLLAALKGAPGFSGRSSLKTWLTGILKHKIVDVIRRKSREPTFASLEEECQLDDFDALFDESGHWEPLPTGEILRLMYRASSSSTSCSSAWKSCRRTPPASS
jgi:RNA polymerase sigma-70 factor (TIGR02943 family)